MRIDELYSRGRPVFSFEFFPPKTDVAAEALLRAVAELKDAVAPDFVSVTYGAGGSTRWRTLECVTHIQQGLGVTAAAHLTCMGHSGKEIQDIAARLESGGIENVLALRGDPPKDGLAQLPRGDGFGHANELIAFLTEHFRMSVGGACYPETHPEAVSAEEDLRWTKVKQDSGASFLITQLFFDNHTYFDFLDRARAVGIDVPIIPGIMPITNVAQIERFAKLCGAKIPEELHERLARYRDDAGTVMAIGIEHAIMQCRDLLERGAPGLHFYTLNKSYATRSILAAIKRL